MPDQDGGVRLSPAARILVVDDNSLNRRVLEALLSLFGLGCDTAAGGRAACDQVRAGSHDLIFMDVEMPDMSGLAAMTEIRNRTAPCPPVVAVTAHGLAGDREKYLSQGFSDYLAKPIDRDMLHRILRKYLPPAAK